ncbi:HIT domain-containing protein [Patescibacteria group bacterium]|nr:HIT domain-containing protein [Patescibacteria group bacterium]
MIKSQAKSTTDCIFCKIASHEAQATIEAETNEVIAFPSISPVSNTHIIIIPKNHIEKFVNLDDSNKETLMEMVKVAQKLIQEKNISGGYKLVTNGGKYQSVPHLHWHLLAGKELEENDTAESKT